MPPASPTWASVRFSPESGSTRMPAMLPTMVTSNPSRIQVIPSAAITNQCHLAHGNRSILDGMRLSTAPCAVEVAAPLLTHASPLPWPQTPYTACRAPFHDGAFTLWVQRLTFFWVLGLHCFEF